MPRNVKGKKSHHRVIFQRRAMPASSPTRNLDGLLNREPSLTQDQGFVIEEITSDEPSNSSGPEFVHRLGPSLHPTMMSARTASASLVPDLFTSMPCLRDPLVTQTSLVQDETIEECLPFLSGIEPGVTYGDHGVPHLHRERHIQFLHKSMRNLPAPFVAADASRPWMFYWALNGLSTLGEDASAYRERLLSTARPIQNSTGGFGGGNGQMSHLASTYAIILALAIVGGEEAFEAIDRKAMWKWLCALKQPDGGFQVCIGGEEDIRGVYCASVVITLLNLPLELSRDSPAWSEGATLLTNVPEWIASCQTFEGGISCRPDAEAHGAYAFCALGCLCILGDPHDIIPKYVEDHSDLNPSTLIMFASSQTS
ncbi:prenyltransferase and squalene oxidase [Phlyctema vagabunda]|uniref:Prenyltransferase and squalene oxidase n=1 Tax=Phlyctema vagabunda TaxID=108571 RepID=A0ABR4PJZ1_9HELO